MDKIKIWATLKYIGTENQIKIWHSNPYIPFTITDGKDFNIGGISDCILTSTTLEKDKLYRIEYVKSGAFSEDDPNAAFWSAFYKEKELSLPKGEYTVEAGSAFSLSEEIINSKVTLRSQLKIKVTD